MTTSDGPVVESVAPRWVRRAQGFTVVSVALVAFIGSYSHMQALASGVGEGWRSWMLPVSVDGMVISASLTMFVRRRSGRRAGTLAWLTLLLGLGASLAANIASAEPTFEAQALAAVYPIALLAVSELAMQQIRTVTREVPPQLAEASLQARIQAERAKQPRPAVVAPPPEPWSPAAPTSRDLEQSPGEFKSTPQTLNSAPAHDLSDLLPAARQIVDREGRVPSWKDLATELRAGGKSGGTAKFRALQLALKAEQNGSGE